MDSQLQTMINNMPEKTGKSLEEWKEILDEKAFSKHSEGIKFLKTNFGVTHGFANTIVALSKQENNSEQDLVEAQYEGKEALKPIYHKLIEIVQSLGNDITITPKKGSVSIIRKKQFALIKPATKNRIDLGLKLVGKELTDRLENSGPFGTMCSHRVKISNINELDNELKNWLKQAYDKLV